MLKTLKFRRLLGFGNSFVNRLKLSLKKPLRKKILLASTIIFAHTTLIFGQTIFFDEPKEEIDEEIKKKNELKKKIESLSRLVKYEVGLASDIKEGEIKEYFIGEKNEIPIIVMRYKNRLFALNAMCTYDGKTNLKDGIIFENKLYCPLHGCAYNLISGSTEYAPARDYLPKYFCFEKEGKIIIHAPAFALKKILPPFAPRDFNDLRKVVIIGSSAAAQGCIETLKETGYTGEITVVTKDSKMPYDNSQLTKQIKNLDYKSLQLRDENWYKDLGINFLFGKEVETVDNTHGSPNVVLQDGTKIEYDALLIATGISNELREFPGYKGQDNLLYLTDMQEHMALREKLESIKNLCIIGLNFKSLETVSTIRKEYPHIDIVLVDENKKNWIQNRFGEDVFEGLLNLHLENGVSFLLQSQIKSLKGDDKKIKKIKFFDGNVIETDAIIAFPNNCIADTAFAMEAENLDSLKFDQEGRIKTNANQRSDHKRIFAAGECALAFYFINNFQIPCETWNFAYHQGMTAAYNILALNIPLHMTNFSYTKQYDKIIQYIGWFPFYDEEFIIGDPKNLDFITFYSLKNDIIAVCGSQSKNNSMLILNEAFRLNLMPTLADLKTGNFTIEKMEEIIRNSKKSGCYKELIQRVQDDVVLADLIWIQRDKSNEFYNFWKQGARPEDTGLSSDTISDRDRERK